ncbi:MAG: T9SS type A sorting domain-containing protein [Bacteroidota bacterium]
MKKTNTISFETKLKAYSTIAMGLIGVGALNAQIVYHDVNPDQTLVADSVGNNMDVDMDGDAVIDFQFNFRTYGTGLANIQANLMSGADTTNNKVMTTLQGYTAFGYACALALNAPIAPGDANFRFGVGQAILASVYGGTLYGHCGTGSDVYLGVQFTIGTAKHYGWIRVSGVTSNGSTGTVKDWAYQSTANTQILAGQMVQSVNELTPENININAFNGKLHVRFNTAIEGNVSVMNLMGQEVLTSRIDNRNMVLDVSNLAKGVYVVTVKSNTEVYTKKVSIN